MFIDIEFGLQQQFFRIDLRIRFAYRARCLKQADQVDQQNRQQCLHFGVIIALLVLQFKQDLPDREKNTVFFRAERMVFKSFFRYSVRFCPLEVQAIHPKIVIYQRFIRIV